MGLSPTPFHAELHGGNVVMSPFEISTVSGFGVKLYLLGLFAEGVPPVLLHAGWERPRHRFT
jgi:hypothetical protein